MQKLTQLSRMHRYESYGIAPQLMPWLHNRAGNIIHNEDEMHFMQFIWHNFTKVFIFLILFYFYTL